MKLSEAKQDYAASWHARIPTHWVMKKFSREVLIAEGQVDPDDERYANIMLVAPNHIEPGMGRLIACESATDQGAISGKYLCEKDDVIYSKIRPALRKATLAPVQCLCSADMYPMRPRAGLDPKFLLYLLLSAPFTAWAILESDRVAMPKVNRESLSGLRIPVPPLAEQHAIASYLDREAARIDALIAAKERVLALLAEKRRAVITRAVTRGLDPHTSLRDSGVPWLGEIPAHWKVVALRFLVDLTSGATPDTGRADYWDGEIPWVSPKDMKFEEIKDAQDHVSELALSQSSLRMIESGALLIVVRGMILIHSFPVAITTAPVTINQDLKALRCRRSLTPEYLRDFLRGHEKHIVSLADSSAHGTRKLETDVLGRLEIALPPETEQRAIVAHIRKAVARLDAVRSVTESTIVLLKERRAALIAAAVTGQIDVGAAV